LNPRRRQDGPAPQRFGPQRPSRKGAPPRGLPAGIRIVHEDDDLIVIDKPPGILTATLPGQPNESVFGYLKDYIRNQARRRGTKVWIIHRLDKEASGLLVFAKSDRAFEVLKEEFRAKRAHRLYAAVVEGEIHGTSGLAPDDSQPAAVPPVPQPRPRPTQRPSGTIQSYLIEDEKGIVHSIASPTAAKGRAEEVRLAVTHWRVIETGCGRSLLQVRLETGRKNQIRVHMQEMKRPIVGDRRYGAATDPISRVCLHAVELGFMHPATKQTVRFSSPTPAPFYKLLGKTEAPAQAGAPQPCDVDLASGATDLPLSGKVSANATESRPQGWDHVADWYSDLLEERKSDHHELVILPGALRLLAARPGMRILDVACGQGILTRQLAAAGVEATGVDASEKLVGQARRLAGPNTHFLVGDARTLDTLNLGAFDAAACIMALMNIDPLVPVLRGVASVLKPGGAFVAVVLHPAFRAPGQTSWGWDEIQGVRPSAAARTPRPGPRAQPARQYRRVDGYLSPGQTPIIMNPGAAAHGQEPVTTLTFHRPIQTYIKAFAEAGLHIDALEEWPSLRKSQPGPRAAEENRARREIPMFLAIRGNKQAPRSGEGQ
jgi:23S rRNA pseudouridine1911/1915/1917 synthase